jgi:hypothetical protein
MNISEKYCIHYSKYNICECSSISIIDEYAEKVCKDLERSQNCPFSAKAINALYSVEKTSRVCG